MRYGIFDQSEQPGGLTPGELYESRLQLAVRAEQLGFWGYHKSEHHMTSLDHAPSIGLFLAALAQRTTTIRLCSLVHLLPFYHPLRLIEEICVLDHLSGGRLEIGFGRGISGPEHELWGLDVNEAAARTDEVLDVVLSAFQTDGDFSYSGEYYNFADVPLELSPLQGPYPPLWRPGTLDTAAELGVSTVVGGPIAKVNADAKRYAELRQDGIGGGHTPQVAAIRKIIVAPTDAEAEDMGRKAWATYTHNLGKLFRRYDVPIPNDPTVGGDYDMAREFEVVVAGSPDTIKTHMDELGETGEISYTICSFAFGDLTHDESLRSIELFAEAALN